MWHWGSTAKTGSLLGTKQTYMWSQSKQRLCPTHSQPASQQIVCKFHLHPQYHIFHWGQPYWRIQCYVGEGMACGGLPFRGTGCPLPDVDNLCLLCIDLCLGCCFYFNHLPLMVFVPELCFPNNRLNKLPWTSYLHALLRISSKVVWGRGWTTCLLHDSPLFGTQFKMTLGMWVWSEISYINHYFLPRLTVSCMKLVMF